MLKAVILVYLLNAQFSGENQRIEFPMSDWNSCLQAVQSAKILNNKKDTSITVFCAYKQ